MFAVELCRIIPPLLHIVMYRILYRGGVIKAVLRKEKKSMNESTKTKKALRGSLLALFLCIVLLIGTTFAWFTDTASTGVNKIQAGNLDVELEYSTDMENWSTATSSTKLFDDKTLWEPGVTELVYLRVKNNGNLALKYTMGLNSQFNSSTGKNVAGEKYKVGDYLMLGSAAVTEKFATREDAQAAVAANADTMSSKKPFVTGMPVLEAGKTSDPIAMVIYMPTSVGNEANPMSTAIGSNGASYVYNLGVDVYATQASVESDSFDKTYDENAPTKFKATSSSSETINVTENIQASGRFGVVQAEKNAKYTVNADIYAVYNQGGAMAVVAGGTNKDNTGGGTVIINGGDFRQVDVPKGETCDLIYARDKGQIIINGGTFKAANPERTLNVYDSDRGKARITVNGGRFYKYDPSHPTLGDNEIFLGDGCKVTQDGDWYVVSK